MKNIYKCKIGFFKKIQTLCVFIHSRSDSPKTLEKDGEFVKKYGFSASSSNTNQEKMENLKINAMRKQNKNIKNACVSINWFLLE